MTVPRVSIVLVTRNGAATLPAVLDAIARQQYDGGVEIVAVDSSSTDGTAELLRRRADHLQTIAPDDFDHGITRNVGVERARGVFVVLLVQDAVPASESWLRTLVAPLEQDARIAGSFARQAPRPVAGPLTRHYAGRHAAAASSAHLAEIPDASAFDALDPVARFERCAFDNVCSCIRRSVWQQYPFKATPFAEDLEWARTVLLAGYRIAYSPESIVEHSHERTAAYEFSRTRTLHRRLYDLFGMRTIPTAGDLARAVLSSLTLHARIEPTPRSLALALAWPLGQYLGGRDAAKASPR